METFLSEYIIVGIPHWKCIIVGKLNFQQAWLYHILKGHQWDAVYVSDVQAAGGFAVLMVNCRSMLKLFFCPPLCSPSILFYSILFYVQAAGEFAVLMVNCRSMLKFFSCPPLCSPSILFYSMCRLLACLLC
jgi:hypothetical protein